MNRSRRLIVWLSLSLLLVGGTSARADLQAVARDDAISARPNILFILSDDQRWDTIHALGNPEIDTPHLDRLVDRGFVFDNAYCMGSMVGAVCLPSRSMLMTGRSLWHLPANLRAKVAPPNTPLLPTALASVGYQTFRCGKASNSCTFANAAFETDISTTGRDADSATKHADEAIRFLETRDRDRPFFLYLAPPVPHDPRVAPPSYHQRYDPAKLTLSPNFMPRHPFDNGELAVRDELLAAIPRAEPEMKRHLADYYATITHLDHEVGRILAKLESLGLDRNTIIIYSSDQGLAVGGRHGLMGKQNLYEHVKPPLIIAGPGIPHGRSPALVYLFDLFPTLCDLAGAKIPDVVEGINLMPVVRGKQARVRFDMFCAYRNEQRMARDDRWKLMTYDVAGTHTERLFDLQADPSELHDRSEDPACVNELNRLRIIMSTLRHEFDDPTVRKPRPAAQPR
jgi:arylsulfatase A-like enzyme